MVEFLIYAAYRLRLETAFLADEVVSALAATGWADPRPLPSAPLPSPKPNLPRPSSWNQIASNSSGVEGLAKAPAAASSASFGTGQRSLPSSVHESGSESEDARSATGTTRGGSQATAARDRDVLSTLAPTDDEMVSMLESDEHSRLTTQTPRSNGQSIDLATSTGSRPQSKLLLLLLKTTCTCQTSSII